MPTPGDTGEKGALLFRIAADRDDVIKEPALLEKPKNTLRYFLGKVESFFLHDFDDQRIYRRCRFQPGAFHFGPVSSQSLQVGFGDLAAAAVVPADDENFQWVGHWTFLGSILIQDRWRRPRKMCLQEDLRPMAMMVKTKQVPIIKIISQSGMDTSRCISGCMPIASPAKPITRKC
jgi:hypothetical protein